MVDYSTDSSATTIGPADNSNPFAVPGTLPPTSDQKKQPTAPVVKPAVKKTEPAPGEHPAEPDHTDIGGPAPTPAGQVPNDYFSNQQGQLQALAEQLKAPNPELDSNAPPPAFMPPAPEEKPYNPMHAWGSTAMIVAALGSLLTRRPLTTALNAAAGVMNAYKANDMAKAKQDYETWKTETANALNMQKYEMDYYSKIMAATNTNDRTKSVEIMEFARATKNTGLMTALTTGGLPAALDYINKGGMAAANMAGSSHQLNEMALENQVYQDGVKQHPEWTDQQKLDFYKQVHSKSISKGVKSMTLDQRVSLAKTFYSQKYPQQLPGTPAPAGQPSFQDYLDGPDFKRDLAAASGGEDPVSTSVSAPAPSTSSSAPSGAIPVPQEGLSKPDGTTATIDGKPYVKQGNYLVPTS